METVASLQGSGDLAFIIDPEKIMMPILNGTNSRFELDRAWNVISTQLTRAHDKFVGYVNTAQGKSSTNAPSSTAASVIERLRGRELKPDEIFDALYTKVPSLRGQLSRENIEALQRGETLRSQLHSPTLLREAFPDRSPEESPAEHYYNMEGGRIINAPHDPDAPSTLLPTHSRRATFTSPIARQSSRPDSGFEYEFTGRAGSASNLLSAGGSVRDRNEGYEEEEEYYSARQSNRYTREPPDLMHGSASAYRAQTPRYEQGTLSGIHALPYAPQFRRNNEPSPSRTVSTVPSPDPNRPNPSGGDYPGGSPGGGGNGGGPPHRRYPNFPPNGPPGGRRVDIMARMEKVDTDFQEEETALPEEVVVHPEEVMVHQMAETAHPEEEMVPQEEEAKALRQRGIMPLGIRDNTRS